jgi:photosystem II stability/assembly factor-like uncharacterized protein
MSRHPALTMMLCAALSLLGGSSLCACSSSSKVGSAAPRPNPAPVGYVWTVGDRGTIMATTDGGTHWTAQHSGTTYDLTGVAFADPLHGWAVGGQQSSSPSNRTALVLATTDGGSHWFTELDRKGGYLRSVACADASHVWVAGGSKTSTILASTNGGHTWTTQFQSASVVQLDTLQFVDASHGWAVAHEGGQVLRTSDGGAHWTSAASLPSTTWLNGIAMLDSRHGWLAGVGQGSTSTLARLWVTSDGGSDWQATGVPSGPYLGFTGVIASDSSHLCVFGPNGIWYSSDGGVRWATGAHDFACEHAAFADAAHGWATAQAAAPNYIVATTDGGATWVKQATKNQRQIWGIACPLAGNGSSSQ